LSGNALEPGRSVTSKVAAILLSFHDQRTQSLTAMAHRSGLPVSTAYRISAELARWQFLVRTDEGNYRLGPALPQPEAAARIPVPAQMCPADRR
jgi:IclR family transcriptional regulator, acetate operon repressor